MYLCIYLHIYWLANSSVLFQVQVACHLFYWTKLLSYADYYERALTNGVLNIQRCNELRIMIYMLPKEFGSSKVVTYHGWGAKYDSFQYCYGTGNVL